jgi:ATP-dependent RNA helicase RhlE
MSEQNVQDHKGFANLGIKDSILAVLKKLDLVTPTPIQVKAIPVAMTGQDIIGIAQTGTGKTFAFGIPMIQRLAEVKGRALIILPTRELATQVDENLHKLGSALGLRTAALIGGESINKQLINLRKRPHVLVGTPGRIMDHMKRGSVKLDDISVLVLDEADMMFDMGFAPQIELIINKVPKTRQTLLFSATMPTAIIRLATRHLKTPVHIEVAPAGTTAELIDQEIYIVQREDRVAHLLNILNEYNGSVLVFVRTKHGAAGLTEKLQKAKHDAVEIHSNLSFNQRRLALAGFKSGVHRILVATDVAARGLDVSDIELVVNFDLPDNSDDYVHRIGRTARAGKKGKAISFALTSQRQEIKKIERLIKKNLPSKELERLYSAPEKLGRQKIAPRADRSVSSSHAAPSHAERKSEGFQKSFQDRGPKKPFQDKGPKKAFTDNRSSRNNNRPDTRSRLFPKGPRVDTHPDFSIGLSLGPDPSKVHLPHDDNRSGGRPGKTKFIDRSKLSSSRGTSYKSSAGNVDKRPFSSRREYMTDQSATPNRKPTGNKRSWR